MRTSPVNPRQETSDSNNHGSPVLSDDHAADPSGMTDSSNEPDAGREPPASRRAFIGKCARKLAYVAPAVLLFKPKQALAGSGDSGSP